MRPALFLDRDGTIIDDLGYLSKKEDVFFFKDTVSSLLLLQKHFALFIVTNQSGVAKGLISGRDVDRVNEYIVNHLAEAGIRILETYVCPHDRSDNCICMKPKPYFIEKAEKNHSIDIKRSFVLGDHPHDVEFGLNAGAGAIYLLSGHGKKHRHELNKNAPIVKGIGEAAKLILEQQIESAVI